ncbi:hypothetical protein [Alicyclobacillus acidoterrestris]|uniref:Uncharacterized protein n=1 Tax=Alicyclobacillus acidoterrestris (strain ATCC 49025 / DSM 3922 / CIP 106132 / NCIMB 13137 / GD3B) TaxID=1356854 RepID=T0BUG6_ALIAG|nr:hypothetical protein [Alicyclobacillus acidoterrestris]EPZ47738.1 hypothetical protein N007_05645 [Alicyclobacillus acidoterrestris ATCC 49025]UNO47954.1 hypothetical protein K1I37_14865 [Alicyclobacillus acidoterrestris]
MALTREQVEAIVTIGEKTGYEDLVEVARDWLQKDEQNRRMRAALEQISITTDEIYGVEFASASSIIARKALADIDADVCTVCSGTRLVEVTTREGQKEHGEIIRVQVPCAKCSGADAEDGGVE